MTAQTAVRYAVTAVVLGLLAGCTAAPARKSAPAPRPATETGALRLAAAGSCAELMADLHAAARPLVGSWGLPGATRGYAASAPGVATAQVPAAGAARADATGPDSTPDYSRTNTAEAYADEPDLVKTDGHRIVTAQGSVLRVVDAATRRITGRLDLSDGDASGLLLAGDRALVLMPSALIDGMFGPKVLLVDLSGAAPTVLSSYHMDGEFVDARQVGDVVRVVVRSGPRVTLPVPDGRADPIVANQALLDQAGPDEWLPRYAVTTQGRTTTGRVDCGRVRLPERYSGLELLSVLTFDLSRPALSDGDPLTVAGGGDTVYSNGTSLYVLDGNRWLGWPRPGPVGAPMPAFHHETRLYQFDISGTGTPVYVAAGTVPGWVVNQYALSEYQGNLRVATTLDDATSSVTVLGRQGGLLSPVGTVGGLGKGQRIYAVRFIGPVGYVVTFRQTDPLYTLDLRDPTRPAVVGALEIDGYSAYLHPAGNGRLIGVGQASTNQGRNLGVQVSLFDVSDPARPARMARYDLPGSGHSTAEFDPHAFLFWPANGLVVVPLRAGALALRVGGDTLAKAGDLAPKGGALLRSLVVGTTLWTVTSGGLAAADLGSLTAKDWLPY